jgi:hypothetical protein
MQTLNYSLKPDNLAVAVPDAVTGVPKWMTMHSSHPSFRTIVRALKRKDWAKVPRLFDMAQLIADKSQGAVTIKKEGVFYKGTLIDNSLTQRILSLLREGKPISHMLKFMDNLYSNPAPFAITELYDWLAGCKLPITDDGRLTAYKRVRSNYKDQYTGTIDNSAGQIVFMKRSDVCTNRNDTCAQGLHFCSVAYLPNYPGDKVMQLVINPADIVSIPNDYSYTKGRTWQYEVVKEVPADQLSKIDVGIDIDDYQTSVYSIAKDRRKLIAEILALPTIKSMLRAQKRAAKNVKRGRKAKTEKFVVSERSIRKMTYGRLVNLFKQFAPPEVPSIYTGAFFDAKEGYNRLWKIRQTYGFSRGQVAEKMDKNYSTVHGYERAQVLNQNIIDAYLDAVMKLAQLGTTNQTGISFPKPTLKVQAAAATAGGGTQGNVYSVSSTDDEVEVDEFGYEDIPF